MNWDGYEIYHPGVYGVLRTLPRADARRAFDRRMAMKTARIEMLRRLLTANGVELSSTDDGVQALNDWFLANVESDPDNPGRLLPDWYSVVNDIALFIGEVLIERCPGLRWQFDIWGKRSVSYQHHVIMGFDRLPYKKYSIDVYRVFAEYGHRIIASRGSVGHHGKVTVRGVEFDLDEIGARHRDDPIEADAFVGLLKAAESSWRGELSEPEIKALELQEEIRAKRRQRRAGKDR